MIFYVNLPLVDGEGAANTDVVLLVSTDIDGKKNIVDFRTLLGNPQAIGVLQMNGDRVLITGYTQNLKSGIEATVFPVAPDLTPNGKTNLGNLYQLFATQPESFFTEEMMNNIVQKLSSPHINLEVVKAAYNSYKLFQSYKAGEEKFKIVAPEMHYTNPVVTSQAVRTWNSKVGTQYITVSSGMNKTNHMADPFDTFYIELPEYERILSNEFPISSMLPAHSDIADPYPHFVYKTPYYKDITRYGKDQLVSSLKGIANMLGINPNAQELGNVPKIDYKLVEGNTTNNDLDIQENERDFYDSLLGLIRYDIKQTYPNGDQEQLFKDCTASRRMIEFLQELLMKVASMNWMHSGAFPINFFEEDDEDDNDSSSSSNDSDGVFEAAEFFQTGNKVTDARIFLPKFIDSAVASTGMGFAIYAEAIVKLARWGAMKPTVLKLGTHKGFMDMNTFRIKATTGNLASAKPLLIENRFEMGLVGLIKFDDKIKDVDYKKISGLPVSKIEAPIGLICVKFFGDNLKQFIYMSFIDLVTLYKERSGDIIKGVYFDGNKFTFSIDEGILTETMPLRTVQSSAERSSDGSVIMYQSESCRALTLDYGVSKLNTLGVLYEFLYSDNKLSKFGQLLSFNTKEELEHKMADTLTLPKELYVKTNLATQLVPLVLQTSLAFDDKELFLLEGSEYLSAVANLYKEVMDSAGFVKEGQMWSDEPVKAQPPASNDTISRLSKMNGFSKNNENEPVAPPVAGEDDNISMSTGSSEVPSVAQPKVVGVDLTTSIVPFDPTDKRNPLVYNDVIVACFASREINGKKKYIIGGKSDVPEGTKPGKSGLDALMPLMMGFIANSLAGTPENAQVRFASIEAVKEIQGLLTQAYNANRGAK